jgi:hypothetical protein
MISAGGATVVNRMNWGIRSDIVASIDDTVPSATTSSGAAVSAVGLPPMLPS